MVWRSCCKDSLGRQQLGVGPNGYRRVLSNANNGESLFNKRENAIEGKISNRTRFTSAWVSMWGNICWVFTGLGAMCEVRITLLPDTLCRPDERMAQTWLKTHMGICYTMRKTAIQPGPCSSAHTTSWSNTQWPSQMTSCFKYRSSSMWNLRNPP